VDFLVALPGASKKEAAEVFQRLIQYLMGGVEYIHEILAVGPKKFMGVGRVSKKKPARRIDILLTPEEEYPFAVLYFTGSDKFNVGMRRGALELGYTMNEHGLQKTKAGAAPPGMADEKDIFNFLGYAYVPPEKRIDEHSLRKK
jgi:DNA polymerase/3'-5' exonuclease PolX